MNRIDLDGRVAIVTGAARGIGRAIAARLSESGARVAIWDVDAAAARAAAGEIAGALAIACDVTDPATIEGALAETEARLGAPDILVNNAGIAGPNFPLARYPGINARNSSSRENGSAPDPGRSHNRTGGRNGHTGRNARSGHAPSHSRGASR